MPSRTYIQIQLLPVRQAPALLTSPFPAQAYRPFASVPNHTSNNRANSSMCSTEQSSEKAPSLAWTSQYSRPLDPVLLPAATTSEVLFTPSRVDINPFRYCAMQRGSQGLNGASCGGHKLIQIPHPCRGEARASRRANTVAAVVWVHGAGRGGGRGAGGGRRPSARVRGRRPAAACC